MNSPGTAGSHNIYTLLIALLVIGALIFIVIRMSPNEIKLKDYSISRIEKEKNLENKEEINYKLNGDWKMTFSFKNCDNLDFKNLECYYNIFLDQEGAKVEGSGYKHSEANNGVVTKYAKKFPIKLRGEIVNNQLELNTYERNSNDEVTGKIIINLQDNYYVLKGNYKPQGNNCNGIIKLERDK